MRRILPILLVAFFLASCTVTVYTHDVPRPHVDVDIREVYTGTLEAGYELNRLLLDFDNSVYIPLTVSREGCITITEGMRYI